MTNDKVMFDPSSYFKNREGLIIPDNFTFIKNFFAYHKDLMPYRGLDGVVSYIIKHSTMQDEKIIGKYLGGKEEAVRHSFTLDQIATLIDLQINGEDGRLLNCGRVRNLFYVRLGDNDAMNVVSPVWKTDSKKWCVECWPGWSIMGCQIGANSGDQVFRNTTLVI